MTELEHMSIDDVDLASHVLDEWQAAQLRAKKRAGK